MTDIQILAATAQDYPFGTLMDDQNQAWLRLTSAGYSRLQIQRAIVSELENMDVQAWNQFQAAVVLYNTSHYSREAVTQAQDKTYRVRTRYNYCARELKRQEAKQLAATF